MGDAGIAAFAAAQNPEDHSSPCVIVLAAAFDFSAGGVVRIAETPCKPIIRHPVPIKQFAAGKPAKKQHALRYIK